MVMGTSGLRMVSLDTLERELRPFLEVLKGPRLPDNKDWIDYIDVNIQELSALLKQAADNGWRSHHDDVKTYEDASFAVRRFLAPIMITIPRRLQNRLDNLYSDLENQVQKDSGSPNWREQDLNSPLSEEALNLFYQLEQAKETVRRLCTL